MTGNLSLYSPSRASWWADDVETLKNWRERLLGRDNTAVPLAVLAIFCDNISIPSAHLSFAAVTLAPEVRRSLDE